MPKGNEQDILIVQNVDLNCNDIDPEEGWSHADFFQVKYGGHPFRIKPGESRRMPRYVAEHFAKHLADHMLTKMEEETGKQFLINNIVERPKMLKKILLSVEQYFLDEDIKSLTPGEQAGAEVERLNSIEEEKALDLGEVPIPMMGVLTDQISEVIKKEDNKMSKSSLFDPNKPKPKMSELMKECKRLGINFNLKQDNYDSLVAKLKAF